MAGCLIALFWLLQVLSLDSGAMMSLMTTHQRLIQHSASEKPMIPLTMIYKPATTTFGFIEGIEDPIVDPSESECIRIRGYLVIGATSVTRFV
uniref:Secreted protein n=1 Tax=Ditylenchus dipsaci TaxID=166011 RepID=A0A915CPF5_9BILA